MKSPWFRRIRSRQQLLNCAQHGSSQITLTIRSTSSLRSPVCLHVVCAADWCIVQYLCAETVLSRLTLKRHHCLISLPVRWSQHDYICNSRFLLKNRRHMNWMVLKTASQETFIFSVLLAEPHRLWSPHILQSTGYCGSLYPWVKQLKHDAHH
jgi:hypothetical protein